MEQKRVFSLLVDNTSSVLSRVSGLFTRRGYNIHSIAAGVTMDPRFTRITVVVDGDDQILEQIEKQLRKMVDVRDVKTLKEGSSVCRELMMVKIRANVEERQAILAIADIFRAKVVDVGMDSMIIELTGNLSKLEAFLRLVRDYDIQELARTGITGLSRGMDDVKWF
ncbi:acetolactate synthase small subunit [Frisingicoccus sp.]|uniref:acetolactate synthase small subunit n=1 Tax=Frisingicoccus sp. TaxID=1918627 RepID=UPI002A82C014|nr:acetolactate synthase small subunit [Frisingicoccus sp.]MDY4922678.1 acetolactate synthase small subunit [Frisingicoccus sp.]